MTSRKSLFVKVLIVLFFTFLTLYLTDFIRGEYSSLFTLQEASLSSTIALGGLFTISSMLCMYLRNTTTKRIDVHVCFIAFLSIITIISFIHAPFVSVGSRNVYIGLLTYFTCFYAFLRLSKYAEFIVFLKCALFIVFIVLLYYYFSNYNQLKVLSSRLLSLNSSYILLFLFPVVSYLSNRRIGILLAFLVVVVMLISNKRGGVIAGGMSILAYYVVVYLFSGQINISKRLKQSVLFAIILVGFYFVIRMILSSDSTMVMDRFSSLQDDEGSGRLDIWKEVWASIKNSSFISLFFGHGIDSVKQVTSDGNSAHNEYLEIMYDFGWVALLCFLWFIIRLFKMCNILIKERSEIAAPLLSLSIMLVSMSIISHTVIYPTIMIIVSSSLGYFFGRIEYSNVKTR